MGSLWYSSLDHRSGFVDSSGSEAGNIFAAATQAVFHAESPEGSGGANWRTHT